MYRKTRAPKNEATWTRTRNNSFICNKNVSCIFHRIEATLVQHRAMSYDVIHGDPGEELCNVNIPSLKPFVETLIYTNQKVNDPSAIYYIFNIFFCLFLFRRYFSRELIWHSQSFITSSKMVLLLLNHVVVVVVVKLCCVKGLMEDRCTSYKHSR